MADVLVIGSINQDFVLRVDRRPEPGETVTDAALSLHAGGKGANQAAAAAALGADTRMVGRVGDDAFGHSLTSALAERGIDVSDVGKASGAPTGSAFVTVTSDGENSIVVAPGANATLSREMVEAAFDPGKPPAILVLQMETPVDTVWHSVRLAERLGVRTLLNLAPATEIPADVMSVLDPLVLNESEASFLLGGEVRGVEPSLAAVQSLSGIGCRSVVITLGAEGAVYMGGADTAAGHAEHVPTPEVSVVDTTAAGDAFVGALATRLSGATALREAVAFAVMAGAATVTREGAQSSLPTPGEVKDL